MIEVITKIYESVKRRFGKEYGIMFVLAAAIGVLAFLQYDLRKDLGALRDRLPVQQANAVVSDGTTSEEKVAFEEASTRFEQWFFQTNTACQRRPSACGFHLVGFGLRECSKYAIKIPLELRRGPENETFAFQEQTNCGLTSSSTSRSPGEQPFSVIIGDGAIAFKPIRDTLAEIITSPSNRGLVESNGVDFYLTTEEAPLSYRTTIQINVRNRSLDEEGRRYPAGLADLAEMKKSRHVVYKDFNELLVLLDE